MIGPTFSQELAADGLGNAPCSWGADGTYEISQLTPIQQQTFLQVLAAHDATRCLPAEVATERDRRLALGFNYTFSDTRGTQRIGTTPKDLDGWNEVTTIASAAINTGNSGLTINIVTDTGACAVTALEWQQILLAAGQFRQPIWQAYFALTASSPIPADYADNSHWPALT